MDDIRVGTTGWTMTPGVRFLSYNGVAGPSGRLEGIPDIRKSGWAPSIKLARTARGQRVLCQPGPRPPHADGPGTLLAFFQRRGGLHGERPLPRRGRIDGPSRVAGHARDGDQDRDLPYYYDIRNYIHFDLINYVAYNIGRGKIYGFEAEAVQPLGKHGPHSRTTRSNGAGRPGTSSRACSWPLRTGASKRSRAFPGTRRTSGSDSGRPGTRAWPCSPRSYPNRRSSTTTIRFTTRPPRPEPGGLIKMDVEGRLRIFRRLEAALFVRNVLDADYQERYGFPAAGRTVGLSFTSSF